MALNAKQEAFAHEYIKDLNITQSAIRAGYSEKTAHSQGSRLLNHVEVSQLIQKLKHQRCEASKVDAEYVLRRLKAIDELDILDIVQDDLMSFKPLNEWPKSWRTSINGFDISTVMFGGDEPIETIVKKIKWPDKVKNLELIGKHVDVKAWDKEAEITTTIRNVMPVPTADSAESWEEAAKANQEELLNG